MDCPDWVPAPQRPRLVRALRDRPAAVVDDALSDLRGVSADWDAAALSRLLERFLVRAEAGAPPPAAFVCALNDLLGAQRHE